MTDLTERYPETAAMLEDFSSEQLAAITQWQSLSLVALRGYMVRIPEKFEPMGNVGVLAALESVRVWARLMNTMAQMVVAADEARAKPVVAAPLRLVPDAPTHPAHGEMTQVGGKLFIYVNAFGSVSVASGRSLPTGWYELGGRRE